MSGTDSDEIKDSRAEKTLIEDDNDNNDENNSAEVVLESNSNSRVTDRYEENDKSEGKENNSVNGNHFGVSDLVWGKVRSHPWWPGQIFNPSDASEKAQKYSKKDGFLIAYFADKTFAWNEAAKLKPFRDNFVSMENQSKTESFSHAVECALGEVSRRMEFGLACKCLPDEVYDKIKTQTIVNAGIREESSRREGGDKYSSGESFVPLDLVGYVQGLAKSPCVETDRLEFMTAQAQLLAYNRHKGFPKLPEFQMFGEFLGDSVACVRTGKNGDVPLAKEMGTKSSSKKSKRSSSDPISPGEKEIYMFEKTSKKRKADKNVIDIKMVEEKKDSSTSVTQNQFSNIGKRICSVIPILKDVGNCSLLSSKKASRKKVIPAEDLMPDEILSHLSAAARCPVKRNSSLRSSISFLSDMRNFFSVDESEYEKLSNKEGGEQFPKAETVAVGGFEDCYWTDRVVLSNTQEEVLFEPETSNGNTMDTETSNENEIIPPDFDPNSDPKIETADHLNDKCEEENPTALILNFSDIDSVPSQQNLNNIFRRYGPIKETSTEVVKKTKRAKVIFKRRSDAETAFSSSGKFSIFGPSLVSYRLHYLPVKPEKGSPAKKRSKKGAKSVEGNDG